MIYQIEKIKKDVRVCIDQNRNLDALLDISDVDSLMLDDIIQSKLVEGVERVHCQAPTHLLELGHNFGEASESVYWGDQESGWVLLPEDFLRLLVFEMDDWERPVYQAITTEDPRYKLQRSRVKALRGTSQRPVCAIAVRPEGRVLEFYSCKSDEANISRAVYVPKPYIDEQGGIDISERCYPAVVQTIAALTLITCGEGQKATALLDMAKTYLTK